MVGKSSRVPSVPGINLKERARNLMRRYGITQSDYNKMLDRQRGMCVICGAQPVAPKVLQVDHDHSTERIRHLLCTHCNLMLGHALDSPEILRRAALYVTGRLHRSPGRFLGDLGKKR